MKSQILKIWELLKEKDISAVFFHSENGELVFSFPDGKHIDSRVSAGISIIASLSEELTGRLGIEPYQYTLLKCSEGHIMVTSCGSMFVSVFSVDGINPESIVSILKEVELEKTPV
ncbi:roadblock/LC7 domain-containing protein [Persephonella sp.]